MKTKQQFFKENIGVAFIFNIPISLIIFILISDLFSDLLKLICIMIIINVILSFNTVNIWYNEDKIFELEQQIKQLQKNENIKSN